MTRPSSGGVYVASSHPPVVSVLRTNDPCSTASAFMRAAFLLVVLATLPACGLRQPPGDDGVADRIAAAVKHGDGAMFDMADAAPFEWDRFCAFEPYTTERAAERALGFDWRYAWSDVEVLDDRAYLVFVDGDRVVSAFDYDRGRGDFAGVDPPCVERERAQYVVVDDGTSVAGEPWLQVRRAPGATAR